MTNNERYIHDEYVKLLASLEEFEKFSFFSEELKDVARKLKNSISSKEFFERACKNFCNRIEFVITSTGLNTLVDEIKKEFEGDNFSIENVDMEVIKKVLSLDINSLANPTPKITTPKNFNERLQSAVDKNILEKVKEFLKQDETDQEDLEGIYIKTALIGAINNAGNN